MKLFLVAVSAVIVGYVMHTPTKYPDEFRPESLEQLQWAQSHDYECNHQYGIYNCKKG